jgi:hypothetical protein
MHTNLSNRITQTKIWYNESYEMKRNYQLPVHIFAIPAPNWNIERVFNFSSSIFCYSTLSNYLWKMLRSPTVVSKFYASTWLLTWVPAIIWDTANVYSFSTRAFLQIEPSALFKLQCSNQIFQCYYKYQNSVPFLWVNERMWIYLTVLFIRTWNYTHSTHLHKYEIFNPVLHFKH